MPRIPFKYKTALDPDTDNLIMMDRSISLKKALDALESGTWMTICGSKKIGKTTFLTLLMRTFKSLHGNTRFIYIDFAAKRYRSFADLLVTINEQRKQLVAQKDKSEALNALCSNKRHDFIAFFNQLDEILDPEINHIFIFDSLERTPHNFTKHILNQLIFLSQQSPGNRAGLNLQFIISASISRFKLQISPEVAFPECTLCIFLYDFCEDDVTGFVDRIAARYAIQVERGFSKRLFGETNGMAYLVQKICYKIFETAYLEGVQPMFSLASVKRAASSISREGDTVLDLIIAQIEGYDVLVEHLARVMRNQSLRGHLHDRTLQTLVNLGALRVQSGIYQVRNPIMLKFFQDYFTAERLANNYFKKGDTRKARELYFDIISGEVDAKNAIAALQSTSKWILDHANDDNAPQKIVERLGTVIPGLHSISIMVKDPDDEILRVRAAVGIHSEIRDTFHLKIGEGIAGSVFQTRKMRQIRDITDAAECPDYIGHQSARKHNLGPMLCFPLTISEKILGVLNINITKPHKFGQAEVNTLEVISHQISLVLHTNNQLNSAVKHVSNYSHYISHIEALVYAFDRHIQYFSIFEQALQTLTYITNSEHHYMIYRETSDSPFQFFFNPKGPQPDYPVDADPEIHDDIVTDVFRTGKTYCTTNINKEQRFIPIWSYIRSLYALPIEVEGEIIGCLVVGNRNAIMYNEAQMAVISIIITILSATLRKHRLYGIAESQAQQVLSLRGIGEAISHEEKEKSILKFTLRNCMSMIGSRNRYAFLFLQDEQRKKLRLAEARDENFNEIHTKPMSFFDSSTASRAMRLHTTIIENDLDMAPDSLKLAADAKSEIAVPLFFRNQPLGVLCIQSRIANDFDNQHKQKLLSITGSVATALKIGDMCGRELIELQALYRIGKKINSSLDVFQVLRMICQETYESLGSVSRSVHVFISDEHNQLTGQQMSMLHEGHNLQPRRQSFGRENAEYLVIRHGVEKIIPDVRQSISYCPHSSIIQSALIVPIVFNDVVLGFIKLESSFEDDFGGAEYRLLEGIANHAGLAIHNAQASEGLIQTQIKLSDTLEKVAVEEALAGMTHDIKNMLSNISSDTKWLKVLERENKLKLADIEPTINNISQKISEIIKFTKNVRRNKLPIEKEYLSVNALIGKTLSLIATQKWHRITLNKEVHEKDFQIHIDQGRMTRALFNIIQNAIDAMPDGGLLTIKTEVDQQWIHISVSDSGHGIPADSLNRVFDLFQTTKDKGYGIGLALSRRIIEKDHQGKLSLMSETGKGTTVKLSLPLPEQKRALISRDRKIDGNNKLLVVNDDRAILRRLKRHLQYEGFNVVGAELGRSAVKAAQRQAFDLIIMDYHLKKDNIGCNTACDFIDDLRKLAPNTPIILTSATASQDEIPVAVFDHFVEMDEEFWDTIPKITSRYVQHFHQKQQNGSLKKKILTKTM